MYDQHIVGDYGLTPRILLTLSIPLFFVLFRSLSRRVEEHRLVRSLT